MGVEVREPLLPRRLGPLDRGLRILWIHVDDRIEALDRVRPSALGHGLLGACGQLEQLAVALGRLESVTRGPQEPLGIAIRGVDPTNVI